MILFYDTAGEFIAKEDETSWSFSQKKNEVGTGSVTGVPHYAGAKYASLYRGDEKIKDVLLKDSYGNGHLINFNVSTLEGFFKNYRIPQSWRGWSGKPLSFVLSDIIYGFEFIRRSKLEEFGQYLEKVHVDINKIKDGDIHLATHPQGDAIQYYERGFITFAFDCGECVSQRYVRWTETIGEKVYIDIQSAGSDSPITNISQVDFSKAPVLSASRGAKDAGATYGVPIVSNKRYVAIRFILRYINPNWINDFATHKVYNENNVLVDRTVRGFTPVLHSFEVITRKTTEYSIKTVPIDLSMPVNDIELSGGTLWETMQKIRKKYPFDSRCYFEDGKVYFEAAKSLEKDLDFDHALRADDAIAREFNNTTIKTLKHDMQKVNVLHCYGEGEGLKQLYVRVPEEGTYDGLDVIENVFTDTKIKTKDELQKAGIEKLKELRKDTTPFFEIETDEPIRLFDIVTLIHPKTGKIYKGHVEEEKITYKDNACKQEFGLGGIRFNPLQGLAKRLKSEAPLIEKREHAHKPFSVTGVGQTCAIVLRWEGQEETYIVRWKKGGAAEYNYRHVEGKTAEFTALENYKPYLFSVAGTFNGTVSEYTEEISIEPFDWASNPNNPDNAVYTAIKERDPRYMGTTATVATTKMANIIKGSPSGQVEAHPGDWMLMTKDAGGWKMGVCYRWTGKQWIPLQPEVDYVEEYHACLYDLFEIPELRNKTGHFGALFAKVIVAQKAFIDSLEASDILTKRLRVDTDKNDPYDFEININKDVGIEAKNEGEVVFAFTPEGNIKTPCLSIEKDGGDTGGRFNLPAGASVGDYYNAAKGGFDVNGLKDNTNIYQVSGTAGGRPLKTITLKLKHGMTKVEPFKLLNGEYRWYTTTWTVTFVFANGSEESYNAGRETKYEYYAQGIAFNEMYRNPVIEKEWNNTIPFAVSSRGSGYKARFEDLSTIKPKEQGVLYVKVIDGVQHLCIA